MDVGIGYRESVDDVINVLKEIGAELPSNPEYGQVILAPIEEFGVDSFYHVPFLSPSVLLMMKYNE